MPFPRPVRALGSVREVASSIAADSVDERMAGVDESGASSGWRDAGPRLYVFLVVLWFLQLFSPQKLLQYFLPEARPVSWVPELLLWTCAIMWLRGSAPKRGFPPYTRFMLLLLFGTVVAYFHGQWGLARDIDRYMYQMYLLGLITLTICDRPARARPILGLYFGYFVWFGIWGLLSLKTSPLSATEDPGARVIVFWHRDYDNRDAFGPLMVAGLAYSIYFLQANRAVKTRARTAWAYLSIGLCAVGFVTSFGRGAFLAFVAVGTSMWLRSKRKLGVIVAVLIVIGVATLAIPRLVDRYVGTMQSITRQGTESGTGADRAALWSVAWREFLSNPIVGVGTNNFGSGASTVLSPGEVTAGGYTAGRLWGRAVHCAPMTILAEYGLVGAIIAVLLVVDFFRTNRRTRLNAAKVPSQVLRQADGFPPGYVNAVALGLHGAFLAYCVSGIFYEILYTPLFWNIIVLNRMLYFSSGAALLYEPKRPSTLAARLN
jgi:O-antigen ligase